MNKFRIFLTIIITIIIQNTMLARIQIFGVHPNLFLPVIVGLSIGFGCYVGGFSGLLFGLLQDIFFFDIIGVNALIYFVCGYLIGMSEAGINKEDIRSGLIFTFIMSFLYVLATQILYRLLGSNMIFTDYLKGPVFLEIAMNILLYFGVHKIFSSIFEYPIYKF